MDDCNGDEAVTFRPSLPRSDSSMDDCNDEEALRLFEDEGSDSSMDDCNLL